MASRRARRNAAHQFNLMIAGHANTGKSSFIRTLYETLEVSKLVYSPEVEEAPKSPFPLHEIVEPTPTTARIEFDDDYTGERISLRLIDTPGLPVPVTIYRSKSADEYSSLASAWVSGILRYLEAQYEATLLEESKVKRNPKSPDYQTHACLYFLDPQLTHACGGLTPIDHLVLKELCPRVNIIPVIAKVDLLTVRQLKSLRASILKDIEEHDLKIFNFPDDPEEEDEEMAAINAELRSFAPFAVVNSEEENGHVGLIIENERILCRQYLWGLVEVQNEDHCDFLRLKQAVFGTHMNELRVTTREIFYEAWRTEKLLEVRATSSIKDSVGSFPRTPATARRNSKSGTITSPAVKHPTLELPLEK